MPADKTYSIPLAAGGLNLRDAVVEVPISDVVDILNWRLDERGAVVKRLGYNAYSTTQTAALIRELGIYRKTGAAVQLIAACSNGTVQRSPGDGVWTNIKTGLNGAMPAMVQLNDLLLYSNGVDGLQKWDGAAWAAIAACPIKPTLLAIWRDRLFASGDPAAPKRVQWSNRLDPLTWQANNYVDLPGPLDDAVTAITAAPNTGTGFDGSDGLLVFHRRSVHRITDDSDNVSGYIGGGSNVLVDDSSGCVSPRSITKARGRVWLLGYDGIYSTDGHSPLRLESAKLGRFMLDQLARGLLTNACGVYHDGSYLLSVTPNGQTANSIVLEVCLRQPESDGAHPIVTLDLPMAAVAIYPETSGDSLFFADASSGDTSYVRRAFVGGTDLDASATTKAITAKLRTGSSDFGWPRRKRARYVRVNGRGTLDIGVFADLSDGVGESQRFTIAPASDLWDKTNDVWGEGVWGGNVRNSELVKPYTRDGRRFGITVTETSSATSTQRGAVGLSGAAAGGAAIFDLSIRTTPLNRD